MKKVKKSAILILSIITIVLLCSSISIIRNFGEFDTRNLKLLSSNSSSTILEQSIWNSIEQSQLDTLELNIEISGYRVIATEINPIDFDENGQLFFVKNNKGFINLELTLKFGDYKFDNIPIRGHLVIDSNGNYFASYNIDDPKKGFFMDLFIFSNSFQLDLAFVDGECQFCYDGIYNQGYDEITPLYPQTFEPDQIGEALSTSSNPFTNDPLSHNQNANIIIYNQKFLEDSSDSNYGTLGITTTNFGVSHECYDFSVDYPSELPDDYWEPYTTIDIGVHRLNPSEAQVKSDFQYYNMDIFAGSHLIVRDMLAYCMGTHGGPQWEVYAWVWVTWWIFGWWEYKDVGTIYPSEIEALWYYDYNPGTGEEINVYPYNTIVMSDSCYSYYKPPSTNPTMAKAFVDYGASAFVGATIKTPAASDTYMRAFWNDLCQDDETVRDSTITLCQTYGGNWNLGDEWRIYGDQYTTLP
jgi:hypothetical protein